MNGNAFPGHIQLKETTNAHCIFVLTCDQGKSLFMPLRVLLTGKLHGPAMDSTVILVHKAGTSGAVAPQSGFVSLDERFKILKEVDWESLQKQQESPVESAVPAAS